MQKLRTKTFISRNGQPSEISPCFKRHFFRDHSGNVTRKWFMVIQSSQKRLKMLSMFSTVSSDVQELWNGVTEKSRMTKCKQGRMQFDDNQRQVRRIRKPKKQNDIQLCPVEHICRTISNILLSSKPFPITATVS